MAAAMKPPRPQPFGVPASTRLRSSRFTTTLQSKGKQLKYLVSLLAASLAFALPTHAAGARIPVVLSTDVGNEIDDQWAITYLLLQTRLDVLGVMSAHAPSLVSPAGHTSFRILVDVVEKHLSMSVHPPLIEGGSLPLEDIRTPRPSPAVSFLIETSKPFSRSNRLDVLVIGAATDVASAILTDPSLVDRIRVIQMGFVDENGGDEYNILNDLRAEQVILASDVPLVVGPASVCRQDLAMTFDHARELLSAHGPIGAWLWEEYQAWYYRSVKPLRTNDLSKPWFIWDDITLAYVLGLTEQHSVPRPTLKPDATFAPGTPGKTITWITHVDGKRLWADFISLVDAYQRTHQVSSLAKPASSDAPDRSSVDPSPSNLELPSR